MLGSPEWGQLAITSARLHLYVAQLGEYLFAALGQLAVALRNLKNLHRSLVHAPADVPA